MVALVIVSHSPRLAEGVRELAAQMAPKVTITPIGGAADDSLGVDVTAVARALEEAWSPKGVVILADLGSAVMGSQTALELLDEDHRRGIHLADAPIVEGAVAAAVIASTGASLEEVIKAAEDTRGAKKLA